MSAAYAAVAVFLATYALGCNRTATETPQAVGQKISLQSEAFASGQPIPAKYTTDGLNISPPLTWSGLPAGAKELALVVDDPDAPHGTWDHWLLYGVPPSQASLPEGLSAQRRGVKPQGMTEGTNSWGNGGYEGPQPPSGTHRYFFRLYALDANLNLPPGLKKDQLLSAIKGHIIGQGELMGTYQAK